jgi:hypothetical protein
MSEHKIHLADAITGMSDVVARITVAKALPVPVKGFLIAVGRLRAAPDPDAVYIALVEVVNWLSSLENDARVSSNMDVQAVGFARDRAHHQWASIVESHGGNVWTWRPAESLPEPKDTRYQSLKKRPAYEQRLERKPVLEVFDRLEPLISGLT